MAFEKTNVSGYLKDKESGVVVNTNTAEYEQILAAREKKHEADKLKKEVEGLKGDISLIKDMLAELLKRN